MGKEKSTSCPGAHLLILDDLLNAVGLDVIREPTWDSDKGKVKANLWDILIIEHHEHWLYLSK